ncbi:MAG: hypothetical protein ACREJ5_01995 [Geminicoccaceae bacterium]
MASALTLSLPDELDEFVSRRIREEAYADAGEYLRALIRGARRRVVAEKIERLVEEAGPPETMRPKALASTCCGSSTERAT